MTTNLWRENHPRYFWLCQPAPSDDVWQSAIQAALPLLGLSLERPDVADILAHTLGEARFGPDHWTLSFPKRLYYILKPLLPRPATRLMRRIYRPSEAVGAELHWPIEPRYAAFLWDVLARVLQQYPGQTLSVRSLWPQARRFALVLTHDVESRTGLAFVRRVAELEGSLGFRSSFNFVPEGYPLDFELIAELRERGFEVGIHGLQHDGRLFESRPAFERKAALINGHLKRTGAAGFRAPLTIRHPEWMQSLELDYDLSFFDTDPFEPMPGGTMSIWPFFLGRFVELPYTLVQDYTLTDVLKENSPRIWLEKVEFLRQHCGMALLNSHPDYLRDPTRMSVYERFLRAMQEQQDCWKALPRDAAAWWKARSASDETSLVSLDHAGLCVSPQAGAGSGITYRVPLYSPREQPAPAEQMSEPAF